MASVMPSADDRVFVCVVVAACVGSYDQTRSFGFDCRLHEPACEAVRAWADARGIASDDPMSASLRTPV